MRSTLPEWAVEEAGAPAEVWLDIRSSNGSDELAYDIIWVNKTATRLPEVHDLCIRLCDVSHIRDPALTYPHNLPCMLSHSAHPQDRARAHEPPGQLLCCRYPALQ